MLSVTEEGSEIFAIEEQSSGAEKADSLSVTSVRVVVRRRRPLFYFLSGAAEAPFAPLLSPLLLFSHLPPRRTGFSPTPPPSNYCPEPSGLLLRLITMKIREEAAAAKLLLLPIF